MGFKRPFDDEKFHELPLKHSRQLGYSDKSSQFQEFIPVSHKSVATVNEGDVCKLQGGESSDGETFDEESNSVYTGLNMDATTHSAKYFEVDIPQRVFAPMETLYSFLLDQPARKQVPIGPGHQAIVPEWEGCQYQNLDASGEKLSGTCVVPMPDLNTDGIVGRGREFCVCHDRGSIRCVRQHVKEAREEMVKMLGFERFRDLGFCDMGEEVADKWSDEDALTFHEIVYSNPVTLGRNFWQHLEDAFCSRTKKEIVSYYFNVFVLRRRAIQNRSFILDIDSDDDEWHGGYGGSFGTQYAEEDEEEEDSAIESPFHQGDEKFNEKVHPFHQEEGEEDAGVSDNDEDGNLGNGVCDEHNTNATDEYEERLNVGDDSCMTFEHAHDAVNSGWTYCAKKDETGLGEHQKECNDPMYQKVSTNGKDLQPAGSIMEEIFGHGSWEDKARNK
uniref:AT-rich interactive domain-containing protein 2 n=1 Tax=Noccaea caerulescens TaxID=107243 RepID=A0A1J3FV62_NOCCA